jgi:hypothetical protein
MVWTNEKFFILKNKSFLTKGRLNEQKISHHTKHTKYKGGTYMFWIRIINTPKSRSLCQLHAIESSSHASKDLTLWDHSPNTYYKTSFCEDTFTIKIIHKHRIIGSLHIKITLQKHNDRLTTWKYENGE